MGLQELQPIKLPSKDSEKRVEPYLVKEVVKLSGLCLKFNSPQRRNVPDRICLFPQGLIVFAECKSKGKKLSRGQLEEGQRLRDLGFLVIAVDSIESVDKFISSIKKLYKGSGK